MLGFSRACGRGVLIGGLVLAASPCVAEAEDIQKVLHDFAGGADGEEPTSIILHKGNFFGTTVRGGTHGCGTVFELSFNAAHSVLYNFCTEEGFVDGDRPNGPLLADKSGNLYGTTYAGGSEGAGTVFKLAPDGTESVLHSFASAGFDNFPIAGLIADKGGNLYGATPGRADIGGAAFKIGSDGTETVLYSFCSLSGCADGNQPNGPLLADRHGNFYGATESGGSGNSGTIFKITPGGTETVLHSFCHTGVCSDGDTPSGGLVADMAGNLYGVTISGGANTNCGGGCGTIFELAPDGTETILHSFASDGDGYHPTGGLIADNLGNLYGTTYYGGEHRRGAVFKLAPDGTETVLYSFRKRHGEHPVGALIADKTFQNLYGVTFDGGREDQGVVYSLQIAP